MSNNADAPTLPRPDWVPIEGAAKKLGYTLDEFAQALIVANERDIDPPFQFAVKCAGVRVCRCRGLRAKMLQITSGVVEIDLPDDRVSLAGFFRLWRNGDAKLALHWPEKIPIDQLRLWTDSHPMIADADDMLVPWKNDVLVGLNDLFIHRDDIQPGALAINTQAKETLLSIIGVLAQAAGYDIHADRQLMPIAEDIEKRCKDAGVRVGARAIRNHLVDAKKLVRSMKTSGVR